MRASPRRRALLLATLAACRGALSFSLGCFRLRGRTPPTVRRVSEYSEYMDMAANSGLVGFQGSQWSLWTSFAVVLVALPGVYSTIQREGQAKFVEKTYILPGASSGGLEMRSIAGGVAAYFRGRNYAMEDSPQAGKVRFVGNMQGSMSQAIYLTLCLLGALISVGIVMQSMFPDGPFGFGSNIWYTPSVVSPVAGWYYWGRAFRRDIVELQLETSEDLSTTTLSTLGDKETIDALQRGVRFQSAEGKLFQLMEQGMEYQPGIFEDNSGAMVWTEKSKV
eukprot:CAMPEP_0171118464 /NCGR_PEP_ID=MMETSP0766_2-20121228/94811_1 /TAXON_ID=439317 /ORGANISM="Gambierdiscus australes, Strain CAWD 149" /LENGTH=278 /DNA_ID=CAMNT_0011581047 /DNA_START=51 /DNA_END=887 /DNA_ORIENTATION=+